METRAPVICDFEATEASAEPVWTALGYGVWVLLRPETGLVSATIEAQLARDLYAFHQGHDVLGRYGFAADDAGLLADDNIALGFSMMLQACVRGAALIADWNLQDPEGATIPITLNSVRKLFNHGVAPGTGGVIMSTFQRLIDAPKAERAAEGKESAPSPSGASAQVRPTAPDAEPLATPAPSEASRKAPAAPKSRTRRTPQKA